MTAARKLTALVLVAATAAVVAATASPASARPAGQAAESLTFCIDLTYPPLDFLDKGKPVGADVEIGTAVAKRVGRTAEFLSTGFDGIIAALLGKKCDAIISGMTHDAERAKQVAFVDYIRVGQSLMVRKGNPARISSLASLAGKSVAVQVGTTNKKFLDGQSKKLVAAGKDAIDVITFPRDSDAVAALATGKVDAYFGDSPVVAWYIGKSSGFAYAGKPVSPKPFGIAFRKDDTALRASVARAVTAMYGDGTMKRILAKWKLSPFALKQ